MQCIYAVNNQTVNLLILYRLSITADFTDIPDGRHHLTFYAHIHDGSQGSSSVDFTINAPPSLAGGNAIFVFLFIFAYTVLSGRLETSFPPVTLVYAVLGAVTGVVLSFILFFKALQIFEVSETATIRTMEPFLTAIFSFAILALTPTANQLLGGALIVIGVVVLSLTKGK
jgi:drug/metabolite transporter (DMT)-like permease